MRHNARLFLAIFFLVDMEDLWYFFHKSKKKIATNIPLELLDEAVELSGLNQTATIIEGLKELIRKERRKLFIGLEGKVDISYDVKKSRSRA
jgi:hypothetical protein